MLPRLFVALLVTAAAALAEKAPAVSPPSVFSQVDQMVATLSDITGWPVKKKVPSEILSKEKFQRYLSSHIKDSSHDKETRAEELALKMFGLVPQDFNLARETEDLLGEQAAAFYDYKKKRLYIIDSTPAGEEQQMALVHELAHALADQQHSLGKYLNHGSPDSDETTAREAVMEGQATWLTWAYESKRSGGKAEVPAQLLEQLTREHDGSSEFPVLDKTPLYMRESLLFPYNAGARFQDAVYRKMGRDAFEAVFDRGPRSTQQILHPSAYFAQTAPGAVEPPAVDKVAGKQAGAFRGVIEGAVENSITPCFSVNTSARARARRPPATGAPVRSAFMKIRRATIRCSPTFPSGIPPKRPASTSASTSAFLRENGRQWKSRRPLRRRYWAPGIPAASRYESPARPSNPWKV